MSGPLNMLISHYNYIAICINLVWRAIFFFKPATKVTIALLGA